MALLVFVSCTKREAGAGIDRSNFDESVRPRDDFYQYVNGAWLEKTEIPEDKSNYGAFIELIDESEENLRVIIEEAANAPDKKEGSEVQKVGDFYLSFMDTALIEEQGLFPIKEELARINNVNSRDDLIKLTAYYLKIEVSTPFVFWVNQDFKNTTEYTLYFHQSGLGLPDRDYYFKEDQKFKEIREKYLTYIEKILTLGEQENAPGKAKKIMEMETVLAKHHWTRVENRDRNKTYNKYEIAQLNDLTPDFDWNYFMQEAGISNTPGVIIRQPSFFEGFNEVFTQYSPEDWKTYFTWKLLNDAAPLLNKEFVATRFDFYGKTLRGIEKNRPRWKRGVAAVNDVLGEVVGKIYVEKHFKPEIGQQPGARL
jgi:predicted metalloendopeptidase